jgi:peptide-methionine (R)-S-oxide reductase
MGTGEPREVKVKEKLTKSEEEWREELTPLEYEVLRRKGTERPFTGEYVYSKEDGVYRCRACGAELFSSKDKFDSGTGWPSFTKPVDKTHVDEQADHSLLMRRTEVLCGHCGSHLGHVFSDGPRDAGGMRYCINSAALKLDTDEASGAAS